MKREKIIIIGAGIGGLSAAVHLAAAGRQVLVLEKNDEIGGKMGEVQAAGFRWDTGPSVITMRHVFESLFAQAGKRMEDYVTFLPLEPLTRYFYPDGTVLDLSRDLAQTLAQIEQIAPADVEGYLRYLANAARIHRITGPVFIYDRPPSPTDMLTKVPLLDVFKIDAMRTMDRSIRSYVGSPKLRQLLGRFATYVGASPYLAPATLNVIAHVELNGGVWYPQGGIYALGRAIAQLAIDLGVDIRTGCGVEQILLDPQGRVRGVKTEQGELDAATVLANVDVTTVYHHLLPQGAQTAKRRSQLDRQPTSCSGYALLLGVEGETPELAHHNILFWDEYRPEFDAIFEAGTIADEPTIYIAITSKSDPSHAPAGCENWFLLVNAPPLGETLDWASSEEEIKERIYSLLAKRGLDIRHRVRYEASITPETLKNSTGAHRGALYGISSNSMWAAFRRPQNEAPDVPGLFFCGGTTHPGGGVPMVTLSGKNVAELILKRS